MYSDAAIELFLTVKNLYKLPYRATQGFINSLLKILGVKDIQSPSYTQACRRAEDLNVKIEANLSRSGKCDIAVDSTGLKIYGEGEWKVRKHGASKRRTRKQAAFGGRSQDA